MSWNPQTQHLQGTSKFMADEYYNGIKKQKNNNITKPKNEETIVIEESEITYEKIMHKIAESKGLTIEEMTKQNNEFVRESLFAGQGFGLTEEEIKFIKERLDKEKNKDNK